MVNDTRQSGEDVFASFGSKVMEELTIGSVGGFAQEMKALAIDNVFSRLWTRPGLDARSRSLVTLGILIALRATEELKLHAVIGHTNGLTISEIEEVLYHATGYAGFPAATAAMGAAKEALQKEGLIT